MRRTYVRLFGWIAPLAAALMALVSDDYGKLPIIMLTMECVTLGTVNAQRRAMAKSASRQRVANLTFTAMLLITLLMAGRMYALNQTGHACIPAGIAGAWLLIRCLEEFFSAEGDRMSARMLDGLSAAAIAVPGLLNQSLQTCGWAMTGVLALGSIIALTTTKKRARVGERFGIDWRIVKEIPAGLLNAAMYPALLLLASVCGAEIEALTAGIGYALIQLSVTPLRRDVREGAGFGLVMMILGAAVSAWMVIQPGLSPTPIALIAAVVAALAAYGAAKWNLILGAALLTATLILPIAAPKLGTTPINWIQLALAIATLLCSGLSPRTIAAAQLRRRLRRRGDGSPAAVRSWQKID